MAKRLSWIDLVTFIAGMAIMLVIQWGWQAKLQADLATMEQQKFQFEGKTILQEQALRSTEQRARQCEGQLDLCQQGKTSPGGGGGESGKSQPEARTGLARAQGKGASAFDATRLFQPGKPLSLNFMKEKDR